jgi:catechol 2,3-dioxygenase-like lactoylglutathione lyase family enzyme
MFVKGSLVLVSCVVRDYDEAIDFFAGNPGFRFVEDTFVAEKSKRWVVVSL